MKRDFKRPQTYDPGLAEQTLGKHGEEARRTRERAMLAELGLADEEGMSLDDSFGADDGEEDAPGTGSEQQQREEGARRELEARRRQAVDAQGYDRYMAELKQRARQAVAKLRASEECDVDTIAQLELEIGVLDQENGVLKRRVNSINSSNGLGEQATVVLGQYEEDIQHLQARVAQLECNVAARDTTIEQLNAELASAQKGDSSQGRGGSKGGASNAELSELQRELAAAKGANSKLKQQLEAAHQGIPKASRDGQGASCNGDAGQIEELQAQIKRMEAQHRQQQEQLEEQLKQKQDQVERLRQQRVEAMQSSAANNRNKKGEPSIPAPKVISKLEEMYPIIDELHAFREGIMNDLVALQAEVFSEKAHKQLLRSVRDQELDMRRKLQAEVKNDVSEAQRKAEEAQHEIETTKESCEQAIRIAKIEAKGWANHMQDKWRLEFEKRKRLHNLVLELKGSIRVLCRIRPFLEKERAHLERDKKGNPIVPVLPTSEESVRIITEKGDKEFEFDRTFAHTDGQAEVFEEVCALITTVLDGYNVCIMAYGQTGSGKTHTMEGPETDPGVNSRALSELFRLAQERAEDWDYQFSASVLEIYNEHIFDLLAGGKEQDRDKLDVKQGPEGMHVPGQKTEQVNSMEDVNEVMRRGKQNRSTFATNMNEHSSRSHLVLSLFVRASSKNSPTRMKGKLHLIDLAGSERVGRSGAQGDRLKEAQNINKSLSALGDVIQALQHRSAHIPYRNSKLTRLLEDSLGGNSKCVMVVNVSPAAENVPETKCSLEFASRARKVELGRAKQVVVETASSSAPSEPSVTSSVPTFSATPTHARRLSTDHHPTTTPTRRPISARPTYNRAPVESHAIATTPETPGMQKGASSNSLSSSGLPSGQRSTNTSLSSIGSASKARHRPSSALPGK